MEMGATSENNENVYDATVVEVRSQGAVVVRFVTSHRCRDVTTMDAMKQKALHVLLRVLASFCARAQQAMHCVQKHAADQIAERDPKRPQIIIPTLGSWPRDVHRRCLVCVISAPEKSTEERR
jgi:hypothetical protein